MNSYHIDLPLETMKLSIPSSIILSLPLEGLEGQSTLKSQGRKVGKYS